jgi:hypothetical protein
LRTRSRENRQRSGRLGQTRPCRCRMNGRRGGRADRSQAKETRLSVLSIPGSMSHCPKTFLGTELHLRSAFCKWQSRGLLNIWVRCGRKLAERDSLPDWSGGCGGDIIGSACASRAAPGERSGADCAISRSKWPSFPLLSEG